MTQCPWPRGRLETGMTPSGHGPWFPVSPSDRFSDSSRLKFPRLVGRARRDPWQGLLSPPKLAGRDAGPSPCRGCEHSARSRISPVWPSGESVALSEPHGRHGPPIPSPDLLHKPRLPWPRSGEVWALKDQGSGFLTSSWFWNSGRLSPELQGAEFPELLWEWTWVLGSRTSVSAPGSFL